MVGVTRANLLRWFLDDEVAAVDARLDSEVTEHDGARLELAMRGGARVQSRFSFRMATSDALELAGEHGTLRVDRNRATYSLRVPRRFGYGVRSAWIVPDAPLAAWWCARLLHPSREPSYRRALAAFVAVLRGAVLPLPTLADGLRALAVIEAAEESARRGAPVDVPAS